MKLTLFYEKTVHQNAAYYFDKVKKAKKKLEGVKKALKMTEGKVLDLEKTYAEKQSRKGKSQTEKATEKKEWFERFHYAYLSNGMLVVGGRDADTNEEIIKKYTEKDDVVFHTDMAGSPFFVIKTQGKVVDPLCLEETAQLTASYSRAWQKGFSSVAVFYVTPEQVTKEANAGESLPKGAFMIRGKTTYIHPKLEIALGVVNGKLQSGIERVIKKKAKKYVRVLQGTMKTTPAARQIRKLLGEDASMDDIVRMLPTGNVKIGK